MSSPSPGRTIAASTARSRCIQFVAQELRRAIATADASLTLQEGLYRAYSSQLRNRLEKVASLADAMRDGDRQPTEP
jgi:hypothetical protein